MNYPRLNSLDDTINESKTTTDLKPRGSFIEDTGTFYLVEPAPYYELGPKNRLHEIFDSFRFCKPILIFLLISLLCSLLFTFVDYTDEKWRCLYLLMVLIVSWVVNYTDVVVIGFIPLLFGPIMGIMSFKDIAFEYFSTTTILYVTASIVGGAGQKVGLDKRFALFVMKGSSLQMYDVTWRFAVIACFLSMWISDTAAMTLLIPILRQLLDIIYNFQEKIANEGFKDPRPFHPPNSRLSRRDLEACSFIIMAYSTCIGGMASMIGSTTNMAFMGIWESKFGYHTSLTFSSWFAYGIPCGILTLLSCWICVVISWEGPKFFKDLIIYQSQRIYYFFTGSNPNSNNPDAIAYERFQEDALPKQKKWSFGELSVLTCFISLLVLLFTRNPGIPGFAGWDYFFPNYTHDAMATTFIAFIVFLLPRYTIKEVEEIVTNKDSILAGQKTMLLNERLINWKEASNSVEWGIMWIFGAGFALAKMIVDSGLGSAMAVASADFFSNLSEFWLVFFVLLSTSILTEFMSATIVIQIFSPVLNEVAHTLDLNPLLLSFNSVFAAGTALLLPIASTSNVLAYKSANLTSSDFFRSGSLLKLVSIFIILFCIYTYGYALLDMGTLPDWAKV